MAFKTALTDVVVPRLACWPGAGRAVQASPGSSGTNPGPRQQDTAAKGPAACPATNSHIIIIIMINIPYNRFFYLTFPRHAVALWGHTIKVVAVSVKACILSAVCFLEVYVKRETGVLKTNWLSGHGLFANRPADTVSSLPSDRRLTLADNTRQKRRTGTNRPTGHGPS